MRNQKWNQFGYSDEEIPTAGYEACVFLDHALNHIRHYEGRHISNDSFRIIIDAHEKARMDIARLDAA